MDLRIKIARLLRQEQTKAEKKLWGHLRNRQVENLKFRRQHPVKEFIVDFFCEEYGIVIELDGEYHRHPNQQEKDNLRVVLMENLGYRVLRIENKLVFEELETVLKTISKTKKKQKNYAEERKANLKTRKENRLNHLTPTLSSRRGSKSVLSTKLLTASQQELLLNAGLQFAHYDAIKIELLEFELPQEDYDFYIFTSQNAVRSFLKKTKSLPSPGGEGLGLPARQVGVRGTFCVGEKTKSILEKNGAKVVEIAQNSAELAQIIVKSYQNSTFLHIGGNLKLEDLSKKLRENNIRYIEIEGYQTELNPKKFERVFDGILFYSPSGVKSFTEKNSISGTAFCIGETTALEAKKHTDNIIIAKKPTVENLIVQAVKHFNKTKKNT